jgi:hypothetical protein
MSRARTARRSRRTIRPKALCACTVRLDSQQKWNAATLAPEDGANIAEGCSATRIYLREFADRCVLEALQWVKCPTEAMHTRNIHDYGKTIITSHRSHSSAVPATWTAPADSLAAPAVPAGDSGNGAYRDPPLRCGPGAACRVDASASAEPGARRLGRGTSATAPTAATAIAATATAAPVTPWATACRGGRRKARLAARRSRAGLTRGGGVPPPVRGALAGACDIARAVLSHGFRRGQQAYSASDGTGVPSPIWPPPLSRCESLTGALDLPLATVCNLSYARSNLFKFVMT